MTRLECSVDTCEHFSNNLCSLDSIKVDGPAANSSEQTCCMSFEEKRNSTQNAYGQSRASSTSHVGCEAENCCYNDKCNCHATAIRVSSNAANAASKSATFCGTFKDSGAR